MCNDYVPNNSVYTRFLYVVGYLARQGFYILIDNHSNTDPTVVNNPSVRPLTLVCMPIAIVVGPPCR